MQPFLSPRQFAEAIGVSESSVRRWADSGRIRIIRTAGGHRKIDRTEAIRFVREGSFQVVRPDLLEIQQPKSRRRRTQAFAAQHSQVLQALERGQADLVIGLLSTMYLNGVSAAEICDGPLCHAMSSIGEKWPQDDRGILIEHRATSICIEALNQLRSCFPKRAKKGAVAVGGAPENDPYLLPSLMVTTILGEIGFETVNLGPNTPLDVLAQSVVDLNARLAWISLTAPLPKAKLEPTLHTALRRLERKRVQVAIGGRECVRYRIPPSGHVHTFCSMAEMASFAKTLLT